MPQSMRWCRRFCYLGLLLLLDSVVWLGGVKIREATHVPTVLSANSHVVRSLRSGNSSTNNIVVISNNNNNNNSEGTSNKSNASTTQQVKAFLHRPPFPSLDTGPETPLILEAVRLAPSSGVAGIGTNFSITVVTNSATLVAVGNACTVNRALVANSWAAKESITGKTTSEHFNYTLSYTVKEGDPSRIAGSIPISCVLKDQRNGEILRVFQFDDHNTVAVDAQKPKILHVGLLKLPAKQFVGIGDTISLEVEASPDDVDLRVSDWRVNFPSVDSSPSTSASCGACVSVFLKLGA